MRVVSGNVTTQLYFVALDATDLATREPGLSSFTVVRSRNGSVDATYTTPTIAEIDATTMPGVYALLLDEDMTIDSGFDSQECCVHITHAGMAPVTRTFELYRAKITAGETVGVSSGAVNNVTTTATATDLTNLPSIPANWITAAGINADALTAAKFAADVTTELQNGLATASALSTVDGKIDALNDLSSADVAALLAGMKLASGTIGSTGNDTTHLHLDGFTYGNDEINNYLLAILDVSENEWHSRWIEDWVLATELATVATLPFTPQDATDTYVLLPVRQDVTGGSGLDAAGVRAAVGLAVANLDTQLGGIQTDATAIVADTNELQTDLGDGGRLDLIFDAILVDTSVIGAAGAGLSAIPWNVAWDANVTSDVENVIDPLGLDQLFATGTSSIANNSFAARLVSKSATPSFASFDNTTDSMEAIRDNMGTAQTGDAYAVVNSVTHGNAALKTLIDAIDDFVDTEISSIVTTLGTGGDGLTAIPWNAAWDAEVQSEVQDALDTAAAEPTGVPAANASLLTKVGIVYMMLRNRVDVTSTKKTVYDDGGAAEFEFDLSDDGVTYSQSEANVV